MSRSSAAERNAIGIEVNLLLTDWRRGYARRALKGALQLKIVTPRAANSDRKNRPSHTGHALGVSCEERNQRIGRSQMREVVLGMNVSLDGYVATADGSVDWVFANFNDELSASTLGLLSSLDAILMGRVNYVEQAESWADARNPLADIMNSVEKVVFSHTLKTADWTNSRLAAGTPAEEIAHLKSQPGGTIGASGGARFAQHLIDNDLVDEYRLTMHPVVLGSGLRIFTRPITFELVESQTFATGVSVNSYRPRKLV